MEDKPSKPIRSFRDLRVYQRSFELALEIHKATQKFPAYERIELGSQLRRAAMSIPLNIAEGYGRKRFPEDFKRFLVMALGSCNEVSVQLDFVHKLKYLDDAAWTYFQKEYTEVGKGINKLIQVWH